MSPERYALYPYMHHELHQLDRDQLSTMLLNLAEKQCSEHLTQRIFKTFPCGVGVTFCLTSRWALFIKIGGDSLYP